MTLREGAPLNEGGRRKSCIFFAATPLQILFSLSIAQDLGPNVDRHMIMMGSFANGEAICERFRTLFVGPEWKSARYFPTFRLTSPYAASLKADEIFLGGDIGMKHCFYLLLFKLSSPRTRINVYEEGVSMYRTDIYPPMKRAFVGLTGAGTHVGNFVLTSNVYALRPDVYRSTFPGMGRKVRRIVHTPIEIIQRHLERLTALFGYSPLTEADRKSASCTLYLSTVRKDDELIRKLSVSEDDVYLKPHPHLAETLEGNSACLLSPTAPAELILTNLLNIYDRVTVLHHGSSTELYFSSERVKFVRI